MGFCIEDFRVNISLSLPILPDECHPDDFNVIVVVGGLSIDLAILKTLYSYLRKD